LASIPGFDSPASASPNGRISKHGRSHARGLLVEAAWAASKAPGPLRAFFLRIRNRRGHQVAAVATARKLVVLIWHLLIKKQDYLWLRPSLVAAKRRQLELKAGAPSEKGKGRRGAAYAYNLKDLRTREREGSERAEKAYEQMVRHWRTQGTRPKGRTDAKSEERCWFPRGTEPVFPPRSEPPLSMVF
jgi:transposase